MTLSLSKGSIPLYMQAKNLLISKITEGNWPPGSPIPSETQLAQQLNISQGTIRKAITELVEDNVLIRRQGVGTFVSNHNRERALFHFFNITDNNNNKILPNSEVLAFSKRSVSAEGAEKLQLGADVSVFQIERVRTLRNIPVIHELITVPTALFDGLEKKQKLDALPNTLYEFYEKTFNITVHRAEEKLSVTTATKRQAKLLGIGVGKPLLKIERIASSLDGTPIEIRVSCCNTDQHHYQNTVY